MSEDEDISLLFNEIKKAKRDRFTGKLTVVMQLNQGGVGQISLMSERNLKNQAKKAH